MSSRSRTAFGLLAAAFVLGVVLAHGVEASPTIKVCVDEANPMSAVDAGIVRAALKTQGYDVETVPFLGHGKEADDGFPVGRFAKLAQSECQLIVGFPVDVGSPHLPPNVRATQAYASTGFVLVERGSEQPTPLGDLPRGSEVGIAQLDTWAGLLFAAHPNIVMHVYRDDADMLADLEHHKIAAGLGWQSFLEGYASKHPGHARLSSRGLPGSHMVWNLVALYAPESQDAADVFDKGLDVLRSGGSLERLISPYQAAATMERKSSAVMRAAERRRTAASTQRCGSAKPAKKANPKPPALYTEAQAAQGATEYYHNCAMCHGPLLDGQRGGYPGPALKGAAFADPSYDFHVDEIFKFVAKLMPSATPGSLSNGQYVDIMAFILKQNGYPAGTTDLTYDGATVSKVPIRYYGD